MPLIEESGDEGAIEECIQELGELLMSLDRYPPTAVAAAVGIYLEGLLSALIDEGQCSAEDVRELLREIAAGVLQEEPPAAR